MLLGVALSFLGMTALSGRLSPRRERDRASRSRSSSRSGSALHNFGEGLAIGASFALGEIQLGTFLIVGFMIHNVTEGLGIATPVAKTRTTIAALAGLVLIAGAPDDLRRLARRLLLERRPRRALLRRSRRARRSRSSSRWAGTSRAHAPGGLRSGHVLVGFLAGVAVMYATGVLAG